MTVVLSQTLITADNLARVKHHVPAYLHPHVREGERLSHFIWVEGDGSVALSIVHGLHHGVVYRHGRLECEGWFDEGLALLVANCCGMCYRIENDRLVPLTEAEVDEHVLQHPASLPAPMALNLSPIPTPMASFQAPARRLGRLSRSDSRGLGRAIS